MLYLIKGWRIPKTTKLRRPPPRPRQGAPRQEAGIKGKFDSYVSKMDGKKRPYAICVTSDSPTPKPLVLVVDPGASTEMSPEDISLVEQYAWYRSTGIRT